MLAIVSLASLAILIVKSDVCFAFRIAGEIWAEPMPLPGIAVEVTVPLTTMLFNRKLPVLEAPYPHILKVIVFEVAGGSPVIEN
jgi:hypothetical protein